MDSAKFVGMDFSGNSVIRPSGSDYSAEPRSSFRFIGLGSGRDLDPFRFCIACRKIIST